MKPIAALFWVGFITFQSISAGWLGIMVQDLSPQTAARYGLLITQGVVVVRVQFNSPAMIGGIEEGDVVLSLNGSKIPDSETLKKVVSGLPPGKAITLAVLRDRKEISLKIILGAAPMEGV